MLKITVRLKLFLWYLGPGHDAGYYSDDGAPATSAGFESMRLLYAFQSVYQANDCYFSQGGMLNMAVDVIGNMFLASNFGYIRVIQGDNTIVRTIAGKAGALECF